ncbi:related to tol protein [Fusarium oxysporum]|uniref:Related to tol protein n=1 Tax=Fusarium oxysporum TaxID=5507 RepID=A0A2H3TYL1_FUSOX|nr:related to tol protein [Fusarium oxysporum]
MTVDVYQQWINLVKTYSKCSLTCPDDRLMAMAGIAEMFKKNTGDEYLAGLWRSRIVEGLNWVVLDPTSRPQNPCRVPPWSWAVVDSSVLPQRTNLPRDEDLVDIIDAKSHPGQTSSRSQLVKGSIQLRGYVCKGTVRESCRRIGMEYTRLQLLEMPSTIYACPDTLETTFKGGESFSSLPLSPTLRRQVNNEDENPVGELFVITEGLVLQTVSGAGSTYKRVGQFVVTSLDNASFFGLITTAPKSRGGVALISADESRKS